MLTGRTHRGKFTAYSCRKSATDPWHSKPHSISEDRVLPWVEREMGRDLRGDPREVNALLRKCLAVIELDVYLMPVRAYWRPNARVKTAPPAWAIAPRPTAWTP